MPNLTRQSKQAAVQPYHYNPFAMFWYPYAPAACMLHGML